MENIKKRIAALKNELEDKETIIEDLSDQLKQEKAAKQEVSIGSLFCFPGVSIVKLRL